MENCHIVDNTVSTPIEKLEIAVIGAGGTGSYVLQGLAKLNLALPELVYGSEGIHVDVYDPDIISETNVVRQLFRQNEVGDYKSKVLVENINRFYGYNWFAYNTKYQSDKSYDLLIICVDNMDARREIYNADYNFHRKESFYIVDYGNGEDFGQILLNQYLVRPKKLAWELPKGYLDIQDNPEEPSCSIAQALGRQKMFINPVIANLGLDLIYDLLTKPVITKQGIYLDLREGKTVAKSF